MCRLIYTATVTSKKTAVEDPEEDLKNAPSPDQIEKKTKGYQSEFAKFLQNSTGAIESNDDLISQKKAGISKKRSRKNREHKSQRKRLKKENIGGTEDLFSTTSNIITINTKKLTCTVSPARVERISHINPLTLPILSSKNVKISSRQEKSLKCSYQKVEMLRSQVWELFHIVFPDIQYPDYLTSTSYGVDVFMDQVMDILRGEKSSCDSSNHIGSNNIGKEMRTSSGGKKRCAIPTETTCCDVKVVLCKSPIVCLRNLRKKVVKFLKSVLPDLHIGDTFDTTSDLVDDLLDKVVHFNQHKHRSSQARKNSNSQSGFQKNR